MVYQQCEGYSNPKSINDNSGDASMNVFDRYAGAVKVATTMMEGAATAIPGAVPVAAIAAAIEGVWTLAGGAADEFKTLWPSISAHATAVTTQPKPGS
jgi:hypothetical protein